MVRLSYGFCKGNHRKSRARRAPVGSFAAGEARAMAGERAAEGCRVQGVRDHRVEKVGLPGAGGRLKGVNSSSHDATAAPRRLLVIVDALSAGGEGYQRGDVISGATAHEFAESLLRLGAVEETDYDLARLG